MSGGVLLIAAWLSASTPPAPCARLARAIAAGDTPVAADLIEAPCAAARAAFVYDRATGLARARRDLVQGEVVRPPPSTMVAAVRRGQALRVRVAVGPVAIERAVVALRAAGAGRPVWVRGEDGAAFMAAAASVAP